MWLCDVCERSVMIHHSLLGLAARTCACRLRCLFIDEVESHVELYDQIPTISYASSTCVVCTPRTKSLCGSQASVELTYASAAYDKKEGTDGSTLFSAKYEPIKYGSAVQRSGDSERSETLEYTGRTDGHIPYRQKGIVRKGSRSLADTMSSAPRRIYLPDRMARDS